MKKNYISILVLFLFCSNIRAQTTDFLTGLDENDLYIAEASISTSNIFLELNS